MTIDQFKEYQCSIKGAFQMINYKTVLSNFSTLKSGKLFKNYILYDQLIPISICLMCEQSTNIFKLLLFP